MKNNFKAILSKQAELFQSNQTKPVKFRIEQLKKLKALIKKNESLLYDALYKDLKKKSFEAYETELSIIYSEIKLTIRKLHGWAKPKRVGSGLINFPGKSFIIPEPFGNVLIISTWNYPVQLSLLPAVSALAAGNTVIIKPSEAAINTSRALALLINKNFDASIMHVIEGGIEEASTLLKLPFNFIFFTGSPKTGKIVMHAAADNLTPIILELGGKSPTIVEADANLKMAAKRIVWGKFLNAGQSCIAPDYLLVHSSIKEKLIKEIKDQLDSIHGYNPMESEAFIRIINAHHFERLDNLIDSNKVRIGGRTCQNELYISPTVLDPINFDDEIMQEEIFGPILPIITYDTLDWAIEKIKERPKPLALYLFSNTKSIQQKVMQEISFGGGAINDVIMHFANSRLPFGGVEQSGMGTYHGKYGFKSFSHYKSIVKKQNWFEPWFKYPPYTSGKLGIIKKILG